jgi:hypothetical protein
MPGIIDPLLDVPVHVIETAQKPDDGFLVGRIVLMVVTGHGPSIHPED